MSKIYRHNKSGNLYLLIGIGKETNEAKKVVIYQALYEATTIWVRDYNEFFENVEINGVMKPRFEKVTISKSYNKWEVI